MLKIVWSVNLMLLLSSGASLASSCPATLVHVSSKLPTYADQDLDDRRRELLSTDLRVLLARARWLGYSIREVVQYVSDRVEQFQTAMPEAEECIRDVSLTPDGVIQQLQDGSYTLGKGRISRECATDYVEAYYELVANQEAAQAVECWARQGT